MGPPHQPVLFLAAAVERGSLWGGWMRSIWLSVQGGGEWKKKLEGVKKEGGWWLVFVSVQLWG